MLFLRNILTRLARRLLSPVVTPRNRLPFHYWLHLLEGPAEKELVYLHRIVRGRHTAIDIGANQGFYTYRMSKLFQKVYSFEINDEISTDLIAYHAGNVEVTQQGLSSGRGTAILHIPMLQGAPLTGWASLSPGNCPDCDTYRAKQVQLATLDEYRITDVSFIKIDVEGHESEVLKGAVITIERERPVILIEVKRNNEKDVFGFFDARHYQKKKLKDLTGKTGSEENFIFLP